MFRSNLDTFTRAYIECALWSSSIEEEFCARHNAATGDDFAYDCSMQSFGFTIDDIAPSALTEIVADCAAFQESEAADLAELPSDSSQDGHDFWLTRNHHGAGFWDRGYGPVGDRLTSAANAYGESDLYVGDDERIYVA